MMGLTRITLCAAALVMAALPAAAQTAEEQRQISWVQERGRLLFGLDRAAWVATDDLIEKVRDLAASGVRGYFTERDGDGFVVTFYAMDGERMVAGYRARVAAGGVERSEVFEGAQRPELTALQLRLARTVEGVRSRIAELPLCNNAPPNVAMVAPQAPDGPIDVYVMTPQVDGAYPMGGHHRLTFDSSGREIARRAFTRSCLSMDPASSGNGGQMAAMMISHSLDPVPTEIHVFTSMAAGIPVFVGMADRRVFEVTGSAIRLVEMPARR